MSCLPNEAKGGAEDLNNSVLVLSFHFVSSEEKLSRAKRKLVSSCLGITYLALGNSNPVGAKLSRWCFGINYFGANWDLCRSCTQRGHCLAGAKLCCWYFGIISSRRQLSSTYKFFTTYKFIRRRVSSDLRRRSYAT